MLVDTSLFPECFSPFGLPNLPPKVALVFLTNWHLKLKHGWLFFFTKLLNKHIHSKLENCLRSTNGMKERNVRFEGVPRLLIGREYYYKKIMQLHIVNLFWAGDWCPPGNWIFRLYWPTICMCWKNAMWSTSKNNKSKRHKIKIFYSYVLPDFLIE